MGEARPTDAGGAAGSFRVAYLASSGRTGSTLLDLLLGNHPEVIGLGEVHRLHLWAAAPGEHTCSCGRPVPGCPFWSRVRDRLAADLGRPDLDLAAFPTCVPKPASGLHRRVPRLLDLLRAAGTGWMWRTAARAAPSVRAEREATRNSLAVFRAVAAVSGRPVLVDSTKDAGRLACLELEAPGLLRVIHQVRDGRAVAASAMRRDGVPMETAARSWRRVNGNLLLVLRRFPAERVIRTRYEDLCASPESEMDRILRFLGAGPARPGAVLRKEEAHIIGGNPMRYRRDETTVAADERWRTELGKEDLGVFERIAGEMNRGFGYS